MLTVRGRLPLPRRGAVLCFHGLSPDGSTRGSLHVGVSEFRRVVQKLRASYQIVPLADLLARYYAGRPTNGMLALTFDDAYLSLLQVKDFLKEEQVPVTVFPVVAALEAGSTYWWDRVDGLSAGLSASDWDSFARRCGLPEAYRLGQPPEFGPLRPFRQWVLAEFRGRLPPHLDTLLRREEDSLHIAPRQRSMTWAELRHFVSGGEVDVGLHTWSHPVLPLIPEQELDREIGSALEELKGISGRVVPYLAAPFGLLDGASRRHARRFGLGGTLSLLGTTLHADAPEECPPRVCMVAGVPLWRLALTLSGWRDRARLRVPFPAMPSPTS
jgi:peptidoglycan/xylan/chitin deacetylase (PgdA/CDA1 family)